MTFHGADKMEIEIEDLSQEEGVIEMTLNDMEEKTSSPFIWSQSFTRKLLQLVKENLKSIENRNIRRSYVWQCIADKFNQINGSSVTSVQVQYKYKCLSRVFKKYKEECIRNPLATPRRLFYIDLLEEIESVSYSQNRENTLQNGVNRKRKLDESELSVSFYPASPSDESAQSRSESPIEEVVADSVNAYPSPFTLNTSAGMGPFVWNEEYTRTLIMIVRDNVDALNDKKSKKNIIWARVASVFNQITACNATPQQCNDKYKGLKKVYRKYRAECNRTDRPAPKRLYYIDLLEEFVHDESIQICSFDERLQCDIKRDASPQPATFNHSTTLFPSAISNDEDDSPSDRFWSERMTRQLLMLVKHNSAVLENKNIKTGPAWRCIATKIKQTIGTSVSGHQCQERYKSLSKAYREYCDKYARNPYAKTKQPYYIDLIEEIEANDPSIKPEHTTENGSIKKIRHEVPNSFPPSSPSQHISTDEEEGICSAPFHWNKEYTGKFIILVKNNISALQDRDSNKPSFWRNIAANFNKITGCRVSGVQCSDKYRNLQRVYKKYTADCSAGARSAKRPMYFDLIEEIMEENNQTQQIEITVESDTGSGYEQDCSPETSPLRTKKVLNNSAKVCSISVTSEEDESNSVRLSWNREQTMKFLKLLLINSESKEIGSNRIGFDWRAITTNFNESTGCRASLQQCTDKYRNLSRVYRKYKAEANENELPIKRPYYYSMLQKIKEQTIEDEAVMLDKMNETDIKEEKSNSDCKELPYGTASLPSNKGTNDAATPITISFLPEVPISFLYPDTSINIFPNVSGLNASTDSDSYGKVKKSPKDMSEVRTYLKKHEEMMHQLVEIAKQNLEVNRRYMEDSARLKREFNDLFSKIVNKR